MQFFDLGSLKAGVARQAYQLSEELIAEYVTLLSAGVCLQISTSHGKDSTTITNAAIEAMGRALAGGLIDKDHPLVILTVDTLLEPEPIQCYVDYAHKNVIKRCEELGINVHAKIVTPPFHHQLMILFANAQKLIATSSSGRSADCSKIFKVDSNIRALKGIKASLPLKYQLAPWVSVAGQRSDESARRSSNMSKQGVKSLKADALLTKMKAEGVTSKVFRFAPIGDWMVDDVIAYLTHAGIGINNKRLPGTEIKCYGENFGLLLSIYGEGSNERCELVTSEDEKPKQNGCGKIARFGCVTCGMVSEDKSAKELNEYTRWSRFGDSTLRFRDYLTRVSDDINCRAFHARAYDRSGNNNVFLQPNVLKASVLEKLVWYASQITLDSLKIHEDFVTLYEAGNTESDIGIKDILQDTSLTTSVRQQYVEMYTNRMLKGPMFELFSYKHGVLLSLLWSLHGITALPYRPLAIWDAVLKGKRLPYPLTNAELNAKRSLQGLLSFQDELRTQSIPDAVVAQLFTPSKYSFNELKTMHGELLNSSYLKSLLPFSLSDYWADASVQTHQQHDLQLFSQSTSANTRKVRLTYRLDLATSKDVVNAKCLQSGKTIDLNANKSLLNVCLDLARHNYAENGSEAALQNNQYQLVSDHEFSDQTLFTSDIAYYSERKRAKSAKTRQFSERKRVYDKSLGRYVPGRASLKMYSVNERASEVEQRINTVSYWLPDYKINQSINVGTSELDANDLSLNFIFDDELFTLWLNDGGIDRLLRHHDTVLTNRIIDRKPIREFYGTGPVYTITNTTGLSVSMRLESNFVSTLKRTEIFHQAGLFNLANMKLERLLEINNIITMNEHRAQKVEHLLATRFIKHIERRKMKQRLAKVNDNIALSSVLDRLGEFAGHYLRISKSFLAAKVYASFNSDAELRAAKLSMWLNEYAGVISDPNMALKTLAIKDEADEITESFDDFNVFLAEFSKNIENIKVTLTDFARILGIALDELIGMANNSALTLNIQGYSYIAGGQTKVSVNDIAQFVSLHVERTNRHLIEHHLVQALAYANHNDYLGHGIISDISSANTEAKKNKRYENSIYQFQNAMERCVIKNLEPFSVLLNYNPTSIKGAAVTKLKATVKTAKLAVLMKNNINQFNTLLSAS
ncbi:hypothetical protein GCM10011607_11820 [Shewanella inventionis]|uniref:Phosphoadenosine phosphosulfate reductase n=1 Tax=Shewanella inventionis TaxID=1738770 RepID=A0ABQ1IV90_9GAMM|nr:hypothetical protein [Shewanella inventionis]GGB52963.1 hypothetical protein GCM10011607_11820 [Shewanella inventionis]